MSKIGLLFQNVIKGFWEVVQKNSEVVMMKEGHFQEMA